MNKLQKIKHLQYLIQFKELK